MKLMQVDHLVGKFSTNAIGWSKKLVPLKHLIKLRKSCVQMILPDIRKCSNSVHNMVANRYSCFWGLGAIWQPLWLKNSHNMAIVPHFLTFLVTFLVAMTTFMHKTCTERTKTVLIHRTIDEYTFFAISRHLYRVLGVQNGLTWQACQCPDVVRCCFEAPSQTNEEFSGNDTSRHPKVF